MRMVEVSDRRRQVRWSARGALELSQSIERESGTAVHLHRLVMPRSHGSSKKVLNWAASPARIILSIGLIVSLPIILPPRIYDQS